MSLRSYLIAMTFATFIAAAVVMVIVSVINPLATNWPGLALFYASLFLLVSGLAAIIGFVIRFVILKQRLARQTVLISFRQAVLAAFVVVVALFLLANRLFSWLNVILLVAGFTVLEFFLLSLGETEK